MRKRSLGTKIVAMTDFTFEYFVDYDNFKMARFDTGEYGIPVNVVIDMKSPRTSFSSGRFGGLSTLKQRVTMVRITPCG